jgi:3-deoxy-D-manno-octulosonic-acid transferase
MKYDGVATDRCNPNTLALARLIGADTAANDRNAAGGALLWVAGSTMWPEEQIVVDVFLQLRKTHPKLRLALVPRHQERFDRVADYLKSRGVNFQRRSQLQPEKPPEILLFDTIGELSSLWGLADFAYVGGSMNCGRGGQSMIEPAGFGVPTCFGPDTRNFRHTVENLLAESAAIEVRDGQSLLHTLQQWLADPEGANEMGRRAQRFILSQQGAVDTTYSGIAKLLPPAPRRRHCKILNAKSKVQSAK